ncbi:FAD-dependent oxidoreductase, partial [Streptomyces cinereoruber]
DCLRELRADTGIHYEERTRGTLQLFRTEAQMEAARRDIAVLEEVGVPYELLDRNRLVSAEPALARSLHKLAGGLRLPNDETGDCRLFTTRLAAMAAALGVEFRYNQSVTGLNTAGGQVTGVRVGNEVLTADRYVAAFGSYT